jgi:hypothetical protein
MRDTIELAREAGFETMLRKGKILGFDRDGDYTEELKAFESLVRADEREACAKVCEELIPDMSRTANDASVWDVATFDCAIAIRNRGNP